MLSKKRKKNILVIGPGEMPSVNLSSTIPLNNKPIPFRFNLLYSNLLNIYTSFFGSINVPTDLLWVIRDCSPFSIYAFSKYKKLDSDFIFEFDDRFDKLPISTDQKLNYLNDGLIARFYWLLENARVLRIYNKSMLIDLPERIRNKARISRQYTPVMISDKEFEMLWNSDTIKLAILTVRSSDQKILKNYNVILKELKKAFGNKLEIISFDKRLNADTLINPISNINKYYSLIRKLKIHFSVALSEDHEAFQYKTPNKFREAAGFGYICSVTESEIFSSIPSDHLVSAKNISELIKVLKELISNKKDAKCMAEKARKYAIDNYSLNDVTDETVDMIQNNYQNNTNFKFESITRSEKFYASKKDLKIPNIAQAYSVLSEYFQPKSTLNKADIVLSSSKNEKTTVAKYSVIITNSNNETTYMVYNFELLIVTHTIKNDFDRYVKLQDIIITLLEMTRNQSSKLFILIIKKIILNMFNLFKRIIIYPPVLFTSIIKKIILNMFNLFKRIIIDLYNGVVYLINNIIIYPPVKVFAIIKASIIDFKNYIVYLRNYTVYLFMNLKNLFHVMKTIIIMKITNGR
jgi:hypothetical protein